jgi:hypothetical protein
MLSQLEQKVHDVQKILQEKNIDGWLLYDFHHSNRLACEFLGLSPETMLTRRLCSCSGQEAGLCSMEAL